MAGLDDFFMQIAAKKYRGDLPAPVSPKSDELYRLEHFGGIPESWNQPDLSNPQANSWYRDYINRTGRTPYNAVPNYPSPAYPWTQVSPKIDSHSNMPQVTPGDLRAQRAGNEALGNTPLSYDELGNVYRGLTPDEALRNYVAQPGSYVSYNSPSPGRPPMAPQPGLPPQQDPSLFYRLLNAIRGG